MEPQILSNMGVAMMMLAFFSINLVGLGLATLPDKTSAKLMIFLGFAGIAVVAAVLVAVTLAVPQGGG